jgi:hypothetical protein
MATDPGSRRWVELASGLLLFAAGCVEQPARNQIAVAPPPVPPGQARVWFYRPYEPSESLNLARIDMNDRYVGAIENGSAFYRDVPPGRYHIVPESFARDFNQDKNVDLVSGQQLMSRSSLCRTGRPPPAPLEVFSATCSTRG